MDSITQITLGAAVGEAVMGRKFGNRAMAWGAIGGTIPDLDVLSNLVTDEISALAFHRAITHSFAFAFVAPVALGYLLHRLYGGALNWKDVGKVAAGLLALIVLGTIFMPIPPRDVLKVSATVVGGILLLPLLSWLLVHFRRKSLPEGISSGTWRDWGVLMFWAIFTHPLLDACTTYGTQLFQPFWDYRVAFNNISVADPAYTLPFLFFLLAALVAGRRYPLRTRLNYVGIAISSLYMLFTFYNKHRVNQIFQSTLVEQGIVYDRFITTPSILNNLLWQGTAEGDSAYYTGSYSILDKEPVFKYMKELPKQHEILVPYEGDRTAGILKWFSGGYWSAYRKKDGSIQFNDLRFGTFGEDENGEPEVIFNFILKEEDGELVAYPQRDPPGDGNVGETFNLLLERIKGE